MQGNETKGEKKETNMPFSVAIEMNAGSSKEQAACSGSQQLPQQKPRKTPRLPGFTELHMVWVYLPP